MRRIALAGLALTAVVAVAWLWPTDARRIRATLEAAAEAASAPAGEGDLQKVARVAGLAKRLAPDVVVDAGPDGPAVRGRETVVAVASRLAAGPLRIELDGVDLTIDGGRAAAAAFVRVRGDHAGEAGEYDGAEVRIELVKTDGTWVIARVTPDRTVTR
jgi:hypothetical protein